MRSEPSFGSHALDPDDRIAIVGMAGRFPGAQDVDAFWQNLRDGVESIAILDDADLVASGVEAAMMADPRYVRAASILDDVDRFDADFFAMSPREAELLDPQHRLLLECAWEVFEDAGYDPRGHRGAIGIFAGASLSTYLSHVLGGHRDLTASLDDLQIRLGNDKDYASSRIAYALDFKDRA